MYKKALKFNFENHIFKSVPIQFCPNNFYRCIYFDDHSLILAEDFNLRMRERKILIINSCTGFVSNT